MKYRRLDANGDYVFGASGEFYADSPDAVAQAILTRLLLATGEWFLNVDEGTPYSTAVLGYGTQGTRDIAIKDRIINTPGVVELVYYLSSVGADRRMTVSCRVTTLYGVTSFTATL
jgi:hypothetical protein